VSHFWGALHPYFLAARTQARAAIDLDQNTSWVRAATQSIVAPR
jgi:hypothetical protein